MMSTSLQNTGVFLLLLILAWTGLGTHDSLTWLMEVTPVIIIVPLLLVTRSRYPLTPLLYTLIFFHAIILMVGGMYTYAKVPIGFDVQAWLNLSRNPYDKLGHFFQGVGSGAGGAGNSAARRLCARAQDALVSGVLHRAGDQRHLRAYRMVGGTGDGARGG